MTTAPPAGEEASPDAGDLADLAEDLSALSNLQRLKLLHLLTRPRYAEEVAEALEMSRQSALKHIEKLLERGVVRSMHGRRATGPVIEYLVVPSRLFALGVAVGNLGNLEAKGGPDVRHEERTIMLAPGEADGAAAGPGEAVPPSAHLLVVSGPGAGSRFALSGATTRWTIGRNEDRTFRLANDPFVSGSHAEIQTAATGHVLVDVFSANGTSLNFARIPRGGRVPLRVGDVVGVGHTSLVYQKE